jgi:DNA-binding transcriptional LysR family regulator
MSAIPWRSLLARLRFKHLELFRAVCEHRTLRRAAEASAMTQPAATKLVREMEDMLGVPLFERDRRGMHLTVHGEMLARHVGIVLADLAKLSHDIALSAAGATGQIRLGIIPSLNAELLARAMAQLLRRWPELRFSIKEGAASELLGYLGRNELDLCFGRVLSMQGRAELRVIDVYTEPFAIVCSAGHALARRRAPAWDQLARGHWALPAAGTPLRELIDNLFTSNASPRPIVAVETSDFEKMRFIIARTELFGVLPRSVALRGKADGGLAILKASVGDDFAPVSLILRKGIHQSVQVEEFVRSVGATAAALKLA